MGSARYPVTLTRVGVSHQTQPLSLEAGMLQLLLLIPALRSGRE